MSSAHRLLASYCDQPLLIEHSALERLMAIATRADVGAGLPVMHAPAAMTIAAGEARIPVRGVIMRHRSIMQTHCGGGSVESIASDLDAALADSAVQRIRLDVESPGGSSSGIEALADRIYDARAVKPITARVESFGASAAFWIAAAASRIEVSETSLLGSIGVVAIIQPSGGDALEIVSSQSPRKRQDPTSAEGRAHVQRQVDAMAEVFIGRVARFRGVSREHVVERFGGGSMLLASDAIAAGMADSLIGAATSARVTSSGKPTAALTSEQRWDFDATLRAEFGYCRERFLAYERRPR